MRRSVLSLCALSLCAACSAKKADFGTLPVVSVPIEKQPEQDPTLFRDDVHHALPRETSDPPDPPPLRTRDHYDFIVEFNKGKFGVVSVKERRFAQPQSSARRMGRFAFELWSGAQLVERVRFDFPLLGASDDKQQDPLGAGLSSKAKVRIPASARASRARILDRKTREEVDVPWPPLEPKSPEPDGTPEAPPPAESSESSGS